MALVLPCCIFEVVANGFTDIVVCKSVPMEVTLSQGEALNTIDFTYSKEDSPEAYSKLHTLFNNHIIYLKSSINGSVGVQGAQLRMCSINLDDCSGLFFNRSGVITLTSYSSDSNLVVQFTQVQS